jgi:hypothetical protein
MTKITAVHADDLDRMRRFAVWSERERIAMIIEKEICVTRMRTAECSHDLCQKYVDLLRKVKP